MAVLEMKDISKDFSGNKVLKNVSLSVESGEIHGLVGENGAGKSTLMNILFGMPLIEATGGYEGEIRVGGTPCRFGSPAQAMAAGIGMVHQEFMLIPGFTVAENIKLNRENTRNNPISHLLGPKLQMVDTVKNNSDARRALDTLGLALDEKMPVDGLPVGYMQFAEVAREIDKTNIKLLIFDEPTAVLTEAEAARFLETAKKLAALGIGILLISHRLDEVTGICHNITVLRDGEKVASLPGEEASVEKLARLMVGREVSRLTSDDRERCGKTPVISIRNLYVDMPGERVADLTLDIFKGEILGIGGLAGHGKIGLANGIMGLFPARGTAVREGKILPLGSAIGMLRQGIAFVSEDRRGAGLLWEESIERNITIAAMQSQKKFLKKIGPFAIADSASAREFTGEMIKSLDIRCLGPQQQVSKLSGGNQQKVCIARAVALSPDVLFVSEPTRGIDIGAKKIVLDLLLKLNRELGVTVIITSSELAELRSVCDRIAIIYRGKLAGILSPAASDVDFGLMMAGEYQHHTGGGIR